MSFLSAVAIAEKRIGKRSEGIYSGRSRVVLERSWIQFKTSAWIVVASGFIEPLLNLIVFGYNRAQHQNHQTAAASLNPISPVLQNAGVASKYSNSSS